MSAILFHAFVTAVDVSRNILGKTCGDACKARIGRFYLLSAPWIAPICSLTIMSVFAVGTSELRSAGFSSIR